MWTMWHCAARPKVASTDSQASTPRRCAICMRTSHRPRAGIDYWPCMHRVWQVAAALALVAVGLIKWGTLATCLRPTAC